MSSIEIFILSVALGTDLFSVAIPIGMNPVRGKVIFRASVIFALFHIVLILTGYYIGQFLGAFVERASMDATAYPVLIMENWASILGASVLIMLGIFMIKENVTADVQVARKPHLLEGISLFMLATGVSIDALAAGFSMGMMDVDLIKLSFILGSVIFIIAVLGFSVGRRAGHYVGSRAEMIGGMVLILLGLHILWSMLR